MGDSSDCPWAGLVPFGPAPRTILGMSEDTARAAAVVTVSDGVSEGVRDDESGRALVALLTDQGFEVARHEVVPDDRPRSSGC